MIAIDTACPNCSAPFAKKLSLLYSDGISTVNLSSASQGAINTIGKHKISTVGNSVGIQQTGLSASAAPPFVPPIKTAGARRKTLTLVVGIIAAITLPVLFSNSFASFGTFMGAIVCLVIVVLVVQSTIATEATPEERTRYEKETANELTAMDEWQRTFACTSCGHRFIPESLASASHTQA